jgi:hypothetical protein
MGFAATANHDAREHVANRSSVAEIVVAILEIAFAWLTLLFNK